jgi:hypothetical protein
MAVGDAWKVNVSSTGLGSKYLNTIAVIQKTASVAETDFLALANAFKELARPMQGLWLTYTTYRAVQVRGGTVTPVASECRRTGGFVFEGNMTGTLTGGITTAEALPPQCALVITVKSSEFGRRHRGRLYFPGFQETAQDGGTWISSLQATIQTAADAFVDLYGEGGSSTAFTMGIWSERTATGCETTGNPPRLTNVETPNLAAAFTPMQTLLVRPTVFTQRRRGIGFGR